MEKRADFTPEILLAAIATEKVPAKARIIWRVDNIIYLATKDTVIDMLHEDPPEKFEIWMPESQENDLKD